MNKYARMLLILLMFLFVPHVGPLKVSADSEQSLIEKIIKTGKNYLGKPYRYRADSGFQFDCSGFVSHVLLKNDIRLPRSSAEMIHAVRKIADQEIQNGDLLFFKGRNASSPRIGHVAMVVDNTPGALKMIHASSTGIVIDAFPTPYYARRYVSAGRIAQLEGATTGSSVGQGMPLVNDSLITSFFERHAHSEYNTVDSLIDRIELHERGMGAVSVFKNGSPVYQRFYGFSSLEEQQKNDAETLFRIGSVSKVFTAAIIFKLIEEGRLTLKDPLSKWFPLFGNARTITVRHLLGHQSGLYNFTNDASYTNWNTQVFSREALLSKLLLYPNLFMPGTKTEYSNTNYILLSWIAEEVSRESYDQLLKRIISDPGGLKHTYSTSTPSMKIASSYKKKLQWEKQTATHESIPLGAGALVSTPDDLNRFLHALFSGKVIGKSSLDLMTDTNEGMGLGLFKAPFYERSALGHTGSIDGFQSRAFYFREDSLAVAITSNAVVFPLNEMMIAILSKTFGKPFALPVFKEAISLQADELTKYTGIYSATGLPIKLTISVQDGILTGKGTGQPSFPLTCIAPDQFAFEQGGIVLEFQPSRKQMVLVQLGNRFIMKKEE